MSVTELVEILMTVPEGQQVIVIGRKEPVISLSCPDGPVPEGWQVVNEAPMQQIVGYRRIRWIAG